MWYFNTSMVTNFLRIYIFFQHLLAQPRKLKDHQHLPITHKDAQLQGPNITWRWSVASNPGPFLRLSMCMIWTCAQDIVVWESHATWPSWSGTLAIWWNVPMRCFVRLRRRGLQTWIPGSVLFRICKHSHPNLVSKPVVLGWSLLLLVWLFLYRFRKNRISVAKRTKFYTIRVNQQLFQKNAVLPISSGNQCIWFI